MNHDRLFKAVMLELTSTLTKLEDDLERAINSDQPIDIKVSSIKHILNQTTLCEASIQKFNSMFKNNESVNTQENGEK